MKFSGIITIDSGLVLEGDFQITVGQADKGLSITGAALGYQPGDEVEVLHGVDWLSGTVQRGSSGGVYKGCPDEDGQYWVWVDEIDDDLPISPSDIRRPNK